MKIKTVSPVHIGGRDPTLVFLEYLVSKDKIFVANENKLIDAISKKGILNKFKEDVVKKGNTNENDLTSIIKSYDLYDKNFANSISSYTVSKDFTLGASDKPEIKPFVRNGFYEPYIPGSSLKGSIRTAILYNYLKKVSKNDYERVISTFKKRISEQPYDRVMSDWSQKRFSEKFLGSIFNAYYLGESSKNDSRFGPNTDIMRALQISDTMPIDKDSLQLSRVRVLNNKPGDVKLLGIKVAPECIPPGKILEASVKVDQTILKFFKDNNSKPLPFNNEKDIIDSCNEFSKDIIQNEIQYYETIGNDSASEILEFYRTQDANLKLGWASGLVATTIFLLLKSEKDQYKKFFKNWSSWIPVSRRIVTNENNDLVSPLGWVKIE